MAKHIQILDENGKVQSETGAISKYFRMPGETVSEFMAQVRKLTPESKTELATGSAKAIGWTVQEVAA